MYKWIKHIIVLLVLICCQFDTYAQADVDINRTYGSDLKEKYNGKSFQYTPESEKKEKDIKKIEESIKKIDGMDLSWLGKAFVAVLIVFLAVVFIKAFYGSSLSLPKKKQSSEKDIELVEEEEVNMEQNFNKKIHSAIEAKNYRLATRYYYLQTLKNLTNKKIIQFHIEKTNLDYQFEIKNRAQRDGFKSLSRLYDYIWYGKFPIDELDFKKIQAQFNDFAQL